MTIHVKTGTYTGNGSNVSVLIGFVPQAIEACNESEIGKWKAGMSSGAAMLVSFVSKPLGSIRPIKPQTQTGTALSQAGQ